MRERSLRRRCRALLRELDVRAPLDVRGELCPRLSEHRGKPLELLPYPIPVPGPFGCWISTARGDYILYQQETTRAHQDHIILHEVGHIIGGHHSDENDDELLGELYPLLSPDTVRQDYPDLDPQAVRRALRRSAYDTHAEQEAEYIATIIQEWASVADHLTMPRTDDATLNNVAETLADHRGWL